MNLMFWKKKPEAGNDAEDAQRDSSMNKKERESLDFAAAKQGSSESNAESPNSESPEQEAPVKTGLIARMKSKLASVAQHFSKTPAFQAGEDYASDANDNSKSAPNDAPAIEPDPKSADPETPAKPALVTQIKSQLAALVLRFKKTPAPNAEETQDKDTHRRSKADSEDAEETQEKPGLIERVKSNLGAFISHYKWLLIFTLLLLSLIGIVYTAWDIIFPPLVRKRDTDKTPTHELAPPEQPQIDVETLKNKSAEKPAHTETQKKDISEQTQAGAEALMKNGDEVPKGNSSEQVQAEAEALKNKSEDAQALAEALKKESEDAQAQSEALRKQSEAAQARAEELRKKEAEEKARAEALKKKEAEDKARSEALKKKVAEDKARTEALKKSSSQQPSIDSSSRPTGGSAASPPISGEMTVDNSKDPKATAKSLKEAIEAMNAGSEEPPKNLPNKRSSVKPTQP